MVGRAPLDDLLPGNSSNRLFAPLRAARHGALLEFELRGHGLAQRLAHGLEGDPVVDVGEEALDDEPDGLGARDAPRLRGSWMKAPSLPPASPSPCALLKVYAAPIERPPAKRLSTFAWRP